MNTATMHSTHRQKLNALSLIVYFRFQLVSLRIVLTLERKYAN
jgi:hypothetical protein